MKVTEQIAYMNMAHIISTLSHCHKRKVGCVIVTVSNRLVVGYNGSAPGDCNCCEDPAGNTLPNIIHAELNALNKVDTGDVTGATLFVTYCPCIPCMKQIIQHGIKEVFFGSYPTKQSEIDFMNNSGIICSYLAPTIIGV
jgi:dCMP deaminase